jgi:transposase
MTTLSLEEFYAHLLRLVDPWKVVSVRLSSDQKRVDVTLGHEVGSLFPCPKCGKLCSVYDHSRPRMWRHLGTLQAQTYVHAQVPRTRCKEDGAVQIEVAWAMPFAQTTLWMEVRVMETLKECDVQATARLQELSWSSCQEVMSRAVERGLSRKEDKMPEVMGLDEKHKGSRQGYMTLVNDLRGGVVKEVLVGRDAATVTEYLEKYPKEQREAVKAVAMDMSGSFRSAVDATIPEAAKKVVYDRYHIVGMMNRAVDQVRRQEAKELKREGDETLKGSRYLWLYGEENLPEKQQERFESLRELELKTGRAWAIKELLRELWLCRTKEEGQQHFDKWYSWASRSRLEPIKKAARTLKTHLEQVLNYFTHRLTNAVSEGLNSVIERLKQQACGYRNDENLRIAILFHCGGLDLHLAV